MSEANGGEGVFATVIATACVRSIEAKQSPLGPLPDDSVIATGTANSRYPRSEISE